MLQVSVTQLQIGILWLNISQSNLTAKKSLPCVGLIFREISNNDHEYHQADSGGPDPDSSDCLESVGEVKQYKDFTLFYFHLQTFSLKVTHYSYTEFVAALLYPGRRNI